MKDVARYVYRDARRCLLNLATDVELERALKHEHPLLVGMRVRIGTGAGGIRMRATIMRSPSTHEPSAEE